MDRQKLRQHERQILDGLIEFYYESGYQQAAYRDSNSGGIYEHKLATRLEYKLEDGLPPAEFLEAALMLEAKGLVRRVQRKPDFPVLGIWPTPAGLDYHELQNKSPLDKFTHHVALNWPTFAISIITAASTTLATLAIKSIFGSP